MLDYSVASVEPQDFKSATTGVAAKAMRNELNALVSGIDDPAVRKVRRYISRIHPARPDPARYKLQMPRSVAWPSNSSMCRVRARSVAAC